MPGPSLVGQAADLLREARNSKSEISGKVADFELRASDFEFYFSPINSLTFGSMASAQIL